ncbi:MAG: hypothetical protein JWQ78_86 [Sediminibacterium sp.]|nr:hypothetical protein [Sediminibacterium sp.]
MVCHGFHFFVNDFKRDPKPGFSVACTAYIYIDAERRKSFTKELLKPRFKLLGKKINILLGSWGGRSLTGSGNSAMRGSRH